MFEARASRNKYCTYLCYARRMVKMGVWKQDPDWIAEKQGTRLLSKEKQK